MRDYWPFLAGAAAIAAVLGGVFWIGGSPLRTDLALCDDAIKATLKAPTTYLRVEAPNRKQSSYRITYDAQNSFGVALRSEGFCTINADGNSAAWVEMPN